MEAEEFMKLYDNCWFGSKNEIPTTAMLMLMKIDEFDKLQTRSFSDRCIRVDIKAADSQGSTPKISSGREIVEKLRNKKQRCSRGERGRNRRLSRSLSALEFEEVKGSRDLGFLFDEEDKNPGIIQGLQECGEMAGDEEGEIICRPYLSEAEAWGVLNDRSNSGELMNWKIPSVKNEITMKDHLRFWARIVASNVK
ncbi:hypothetical protein ACS0TY_017579 [Phlomoides rotata]